MEVFLDPTPIRSRDLSEAEMAHTAGGVLPIAVTAVINCGPAFAGVVIGVVQIIDR